jgi:hypothetical protein
VATVPSTPPNPVEGTTSQVPVPQSSVPPKKPHEQKSAVLLTQTPCSPCACGQDGFVAGNGGRHKAWQTGTTVHCVPVGHGPVGNGYPPLEHPTRLPFQHVLSIPVHSGIGCVEAMHPVDGAMVMSHATEQTPPSIHVKPLALQSGPPTKSVAKGFVQAHAKTWFPSHFKYSVELSQAAPTPWPPPQPSGRPLPMRTAMAWAFSNISLQSTSTRRVRRLTGPSSWTGRCRAHHGLLTRWVAVTPLERLSFEQLVA